jgi:SAM-dependent methyltransferase
VLAAFAEPFVEGRRVLVFGSALASTPRLLVERGARLVHVCDPAPLRVAEAIERAAAPGLSFSTFTDEPLAAREGGFDCVLVENLAAFDARTVVAKARRLLAPRGVALFATPNREAQAPLLPAPEQGAAPLDYYALYDLVASEFEHVRMLGQAPFVGYAVVEFAPQGTPEPMIDSDFLPRGSEEPELFVAVAARQRPELASYALVQLPLHRVLANAGTHQAAEKAAAVPEARGAQVRDLGLERKLAKQEAWIGELEARAETADARADQAEEALEEREAELAASKQALAQSSGELERVRAELASARAELEASKGELATHAAGLATRAAELATHAAELERARAGDRARHDQAAAALAERDARILELERTPPPAPEPDSSADVDALEAKLAERGRELRRLEQELAEAERVGRELVAELSKARLAPNPELARELAELAVRLATSEADRLALTWAAAVGPRAGSG